MLHSDGSFSRNKLTGSKGKAHAISPFDDTAQTYKREESDHNEMMDIRYVECVVYYILLLSYLLQKGGRDEIERLGSILHTTSKGQRPFGSRC